MATGTNRFLAGILSIIVPGSGQIYNGEVKKGWVILGSCVSLAALTYWIEGLNKITVALAFLLLWLSAIVDAYKVAMTSGRESEFYYRKAYVVTMLLLVGPLGLPLLWQSPNFSAAARWIWTVIVVGVVLLFIGTPYLAKWLIG